MGVALSNQNMYQEATELYTKAVKINLNQSSVYADWAWALHQLGMYDEAAAKYAQASQLDPKNSEIYNKWGLTLDKKGTMMKL